MNLVLHLGFHKTGSSSIQSFCENNREQLIAKGYLYPVNGAFKLEIPSKPSSQAGHRLFETVLTSPGTSESRELLKSIVREAKQYKHINTVILSSETFSAPRIKVHTAVLQELQCHFEQVKILVFLRRQDDWAESFYKEVLCWPGKHETRAFEEFVHEHLQEWLDYRNRLAEWDKIFGIKNMIVRSYHSAKNQNIVEDFLECLNINVEKNDNIVQRERSNPSLPVDLVPLMRRVNQLPLSRENRSLITHRIFDALSKSDSETIIEPLLTKSLISDFVEKFSSENKYLVEKYKIIEGNYLSFAKNGALRKQERTLNSEQKEEIIAYAKKLARKQKNTDTRIIENKNSGRVGISCLVNESPEQVKIFVFYHLAIGVSRIRLYFDNPLDPMLDYDYGDESVETIPCNAEFWMEVFGREPENLEEKLSVCHKDGLNYLGRHGNVDWSINLDADELLYIKPTTSLKNYLAKVDNMYEQIRVLPLEGIFVDPEDTKLFSAKYFKVPRYKSPGDITSLSRHVSIRLKHRLVALLGILSALNIFRKIAIHYTDTAGVIMRWNKRDNHLYSKFMPLLSSVMREGFLGHREGRVLTRSGIKLDKVTSHNPTNSGKVLNCKPLNNSIFVLHYDAVEFSAWYKKWDWRVRGNTVTVAVHDKRRMQERMFGEAQEKGYKEVEKLFNDLFVFPASSMKELELDGLVVKLNIPALEKIKNQLEY